MAITANSLNGYLQVFAEKSLTQFIASAPLLKAFTSDFSPSISAGGTSVTTRYSTGNWSTANLLGTNGWAKTQATASAVKITVNLYDFDIQINEQDMATMTPQMIIGTFLPPMAKQLANSVVVNAINNINKITSSTYTNVLTIPTSSNFQVTGANSMNSASQALDLQEIPDEGRYCIVTPTLYEYLLASCNQTYLYGNPSLIQNYGYGTGTTRAVQLLNIFPILKYARLYGAATPQGGDKYSGNDRLVGFVGNPEALAVAIRAPLDVFAGTTQTATATDKSSGISIQTRLVYDQSIPCWRLAVVSLYGSAAGVTNALVPIITSTT